MEDLVQTISNIVGILLGLVGAVGVGFFIFGAYLYLTASGAPHQMERGKSAMMTALAGIVLAMVAYGIVELVMGAVVDPVVDIEDVLRSHHVPHRDAARIVGVAHASTRSTYPRAGRGPRPAVAPSPAVLLVQYNLLPAANRRQQPTCSEDS